MSVEGRRSGVTSGQSKIVKAAAFAMERSIMNVKY
jgi:hypothetical protein